jgi:PAS domain S-box-containing protein
MSRSHGGLELLVAVGEQTFGSTVADAVEATGDAAVTAQVETAREALARTEREEVDGVVVDDRLSESMSVVDQVTSEQELPVVLLTDPRANGETVSGAIEAGATDVFPRTTTSAQYELVVERIASERAGSPSVTDRQGQRQPYRDIFENASDGMVVHDPETGEILEVNEEYCEMTGFSREELVGETVGLVTADAPEYSVERARERIQRAREEGAILFEWLNKHRDGTTVPVEVNLKLVELYGEERVLANVRDITERKRRERDYEEIFDKVTDAIAVFDPESGNFVDVNNSYREMFGYDDLERIRELGIEGLSASEEGFTEERGAQLIQEVSETGEQRTVEWQGERRDGERFWMESTLAPAEIGGEERVLSIQRDITERKRREQEYEQIFDGVNDAIAVFDPETGQITEVNEPYYEMVGYDDLARIRELGIEGLSAGAEFTGQRGQELVREVSETGEPRTVEWQAETAGGDRIWLEVTLSPATVRGEERVLSIQRDITERKRREREFEEIFNSVEDAIVVWDPDTMEVLDANGAYLEMLGYEDLAAVREQGVGGLSATEAGYTERRGQEIHQRVRRTGEPEMVEWQGETSDGERIWLEVKVTPAVIGGQERTVSIQRDITERKRREQMVRSLHDATDRLHKPETMRETCQTTVEVARDALDLPLTAFWRHRETADGPVLEPVAGTEPVQELDPLWFRPGDEEYEAFRQREVRVHDPSEQFPENPLEASILLPIGDHGLLAAGKVGVEEYDEFVVDAARTLAGHVRTALDRVEREQAVRESERRFRLIAQRIEEVIYLTRPDFSEILYVNPAYEEIFGTSVETLSEDATAFIETIDERDREAFLADFEEMLAEIQSGTPQESYEFEYRIRRPGGEVRWVHATGYVDELSGENPRFVGIVDDITERKRREQRLEVFNRILRHNLRNQLDVIRSHAEVLADQATDDHAERIIAAVDELAGMGTRARKSDQIMAMDAAPTESDLSALLSDLVDNVGPLPEGLEVETAMPERAPLTTSEDAVRIAVQNALENAIEHGNATVRLAVEESPAGYRVVVEDDGPGIPEEELVPIETGTETNLRHGRGLGLWQLRWSVDMINGELSFDTTEGTTVTITVPDQSGPDRAED